MATLTKKDKKSILLGTLLGDSCLWRHPKAKRFNLQFTHSEKQLEYAKWKADLVSNMLFEKDATLWKSINRGYSKITAYTYRSQVDPLIESVRKLLYKDRRKTITRKMLDCLTPIGLAIWYMDDGFKEIHRYKGKTTIKQRSMGLSTCSFSEQEQDIIIQYFKEKLNVVLHKYYRKGPKNWILKCGVTEGIKFHDLIQPYVPKSMRYKLFYEFSIRNILQCRASNNMEDDIVHTNRNIGIM